MKIVKSIYDDYIRWRYEPAVTIREFRGSFRFLSNMYLTPITYKGHSFMSSENAYMAMKAPNDPIWLQFCLTDKPKVVKRKSREMKLDDKWHEIKVSIMREILIAKFSNKRLLNMLMSTNFMELEEGNDWNDTFWGVCLRTNEGHNHLGKILMEIRDRHYYSLMTSK